AFALAILGRRRAFESHEVMRRGGWGVDESGSRFRQHLQSSGLPLAKALGLDAPLRGLWRRMVRQPGKDVVRPSRMLRGATAGLIGWGSNAGALAARLTAAGATVLVYSEHATDDEIVSAKRSSLADVLAADIVSLHRGLTPATRHFLGTAELSQLRPGT